MIKLALCLFVSISIVVAALDSVSLFIDIPSILIVTVFGAFYAVSGVYSVKDRINNFSKGAVLGGWLGVVIGAVQMLGTGGEALFESSKLYDASAILILTLFWAYWLKGICFVLAENLPQDEN
jgi:hypothetical protein|tara:strand:- start:233 stop:601 length:369 start_codon:yes stop_codon:yes gene_type:complete